MQKREHSPEIGRIRINLRCRESAIKAGNRQRRHFMSRHAVLARSLETKRAQHPSHSCDRPHPMRPDNIQSPRIDVPGASPANGTTSLVLTSRTGGGKTQTDKRSQHSVVAGEEDIGQLQRLDANLAVNQLPPSAIDREPSFEAPPVTSDIRHHREDGYRFDTTAPAAGLANKVPSLHSKPPL